jgi:DNA-binding Xre family transcriptional regulator
MPTRHLKVEDYIDFRKLNEWLAHNDISASWLADQIGVSTSTVTRFLNSWLDGNRNPSVTIFLAICRALKVPDGAFQLHLGGLPVRFDELAAPMHEEHFQHIGGGYCLTSYSREMDSYWTPNELTDEIRLANLGRQGIVEPKLVTPYLEMFRAMHQSRTLERLGADYIIQIIGSPATIRQAMQKKPELAHEIRVRMRFKKQRTVFGMLKPDKEQELYRKVCDNLGIAWFSKVNLRDNTTLACWQGTLVMTWYDPNQAAEVRKLIEDFAGSKENADVRLPRLEDLYKRGRIIDASVEEANNAACAFFDSIAPLDRSAATIILPSGNPPAANGD